MKRLIAVLSAAAFLCEVPGCVIAHTRPMSELRPATSQRISGFTTLDGSRHPCYCHAQIDGNTVRFRLRETDAAAPPEEDARIPTALSVAEIASVDVMETSSGWTTVTIVAIVGLLVLLVRPTSLPSSFLSGSW